MNKPRIYVTREIPKIGLEILSKYCEITIHKGEEPPSKEEIIINIQGKDGLLCMLTDKIDVDIINASSNIKVISSFSVGLDHIDINEATRRGIYVTYTPGVLTNDTADLAFALMVSTARRISEGDRFVRSGDWKGGWGPNMFLGEGIWGKTLGIIGLGRIGTAVAERALGFKMKILYHNRNRSLLIEKRLNVKYRSLENLLKESDFISLHIPLTPDTYHLIDRKKLNLIKRNSIIINTSRGQIIDEDALVDALLEERISGAGIDVFPIEPLPVNSRLLKTKNTVLTPHIGSATYHTRNLMSEISANNLLLVLKGQEPLHLFNKKVKKIRSLDKVRLI
ncbi:2-hydroxyacid dehydrogenase [Thermoproteota archaeon]